MQRFIAYYVFYSDEENNLTVGHSLTYLNSPELNNKGEGYKSSFSLMPRNNTGLKHESIFVPGEPSSPSQAVSSVGSSPFM